MYTTGFTAIIIWACILAEQNEVFPNKITAYQSPLPINIDDQVHASKWDWIWMDLRTLLVIHLETRQIRQNMTCMHRHAVGWDNYTYVVVAMSYMDYQLHMAAHYFVAVKQGATPDLEVGGGHVCCGGRS